MPSTFPRTSRLGAWLLAPAVLLAGAALTVTRTAGAATAPSDILVTSIAAKDRSAALKYWTTARMRKTGDGADSPPEVVGRPWPGTPPRGVGRLFFVAKEGPSGPASDDWCTATVVRGTSKDVAITAAHCFWPGYTRDDKLITVSNVVFVPAYANGAQPHGAFAARAFLLPKSYTKEGAPDVAMLALDPVKGQHAADAAGAQDVTFSATTAGRAATFGYPGSAKVRGQSLSWCDLKATQDGDPDRWRILCDLAGGASGGPWLSSFNPATGTGTIFSVTSQGSQTVDDSGQVRTTDLVGPKLGASAKSIYTEAQHR